MSVQVIAPVVEGFFFTAGCLGIHSLRRYADRLTPLLAITAIALASILLMTFEGAVPPVDQDTSFQYLFPTM